MFCSAFRERNLADQLEGVCTEFTNWRTLVNIPIRQLLCFQRFTGWQLNCIANRERRRTKDRERERGKMLRIRRSANGEVVFSLSGRMSLEDIAELETQIKSEASGRQLVLDLKHVTLAGQDAIAFLARCEADNIKLKNCAVYVREWITRQRESS